MPQEHFSGRDLQPARLSATLIDIPRAIWISPDSPMSDQVLGGNKQIVLILSLKFPFFLLRVSPVSHFMTPVTCGLDRIRT